MTITNTYRWNGQLGSEWTKTTSPPNPKSNWDNLSDPGATPSFPSGAGDLAVIDLGGAISITGADGGGNADEMQVVSGSSRDLAIEHQVFGGASTHQNGNAVLKIARRQQKPILRRALDRVPERPHSARDDRNLKDRIDPGQA